MPGPGCVMVMGRVVGLGERVVGSKLVRAARGCLRVVVGDGGGCVVVCGVFFAQAGGLFGGAGGGRLWWIVADSLELWCRLNSGTARSTTSSDLGIWSRCGRHMFRMRRRGWWGIGMGAR